MPALPPGPLPSPAGTPVRGSVTAVTGALPQDVLDAAHHGAWLLSPAVPAGLGVLTAAAVALAVVAAVRRRRRTRPDRWRWRRLALQVTGVLALLALTAAAAVNAYAGYLPDLTAVARWARGDETGTGSDAGALPAAAPAAGAVPAAAARVRHALALARLASDYRVGQAGTLPGWQVSAVHLSDPELRIADRTVLVALPPGYADPAQADRRYPVAYLLSGEPGRPSDWFGGGRVRETLDALVRDHLAPEEVLVAPDVNGGFTTDSETLDAVGGPQVQTWLTRDVVGWVDQHVRTLPTRSERVLVGMSSGGYAALDVALRHQDEFGLVAALEPYGDPGDVRQRLLGGSLARLRADSPSWYLPTLPLHRRSRFFLDVGGATRDVPAVRALADELAARGQQVQLRVEPGQGHTWSETVEGLPYALASTAAGLGDPALEESLPESAFPPAGAPSGPAYLLGVRPSRGASAPPSADPSSRPSATASRRP